MDSVTVWTTVHDEKATCSFGDPHYVAVVARKVLGPVVGTRIHDNGYQRHMTELRLDRQGREYHKRIEIDYSNNIWWLRDDGKHFRPRPPRLWRMIGSRSVHVE